MVEVSLTVGKLDASLALLLTKDHHLIEFPTILLPNGVKAGSIVKIKCEQDLETEKVEAENFQKIQDEILNTFGKSLPKSPNLKIKNITQTSCVLEWDPLDLGTSNLKNLILYKDGKKLGSIPQPLTNKTTKLSGLPIDKTFSFQIKLDTTAGIYSSEVIEVTTHKMTDLSGITVCLGDLSPNDPFTKQDIEDAIKNIGARPYQDKIQVDTTHFICTRENKTNAEYMKAQDMNIPIIRPEWLKACEHERRIVGVTAFYLKECVLPDILAKNYWNKGDQKELPKAPVETNGHGVSESTSATAQPDTETAPDAEEEPVQVTPQEESSTDKAVEQPETSEDLGSNPETKVEPTVEDQTVKTSEPANIESKPVEAADLSDSKSVEAEDLSESKPIEAEDLGETKNNEDSSNFDEVDIDDLNTESTQLAKPVELKSESISQSIPTNDEEEEEEPIIKEVDVSVVSIQSPEQVVSQTALVEPVETEEDVAEQAKEQDVADVAVEKDVTEQDTVEKEEVEAVAEPVVEKEEAIAEPVAVEKEEEASVVTEQVSVEKDVQAEQDTEQEESEDAEDAEDAEQVPAETTNGTPSKPKAKPKKKKNNKKKK